MRFGKTLRTSVYPPWKDQYLDYSKLKSMLREDEPDDDSAGPQPWTEDDENRFCDAIFNEQLEKVAAFQQRTEESLRERVEAAFEKLKELTPAEGAGDEAPKGEITAQRLKELEAELDAITNEVRELKKYSSLNYTGFLKIVKKHDRKRGDSYKIRPLMQLSLAKRPFNSERGYAPLLNKLSLMYFAIRQHLEARKDGKDGDGEGDGDAAHPIAAGAALGLDLALDSPPEMHNGERYTAHKFWVHPDNLLEVKTFIMRRLPALVYSEQSARELDGGEDPALTSLYFDNAKFELYTRKLESEIEAASLRLRWYGQLSAKPEIFLEQKIVHEDSVSEDRKVTIKEKYIKPFLAGDYKLEKTVQKMERQGQSEGHVKELEGSIEVIQHFVKEKKLQPVLRANYARTAFQKPADDSVRISIDTDVAFIREDALDKERPCRDPKAWHRTDIDRSNMAYPFSNINQSEVSRFPYAILELKLKEDGTRKRPQWIEDLMASHLVHPAPRFSKFVHGVASLFEDHVNRLPFWLSDLEVDIRKDPQVAFDEEEQRKAVRAQGEQVVGSFLGTKLSSFKPSKSSPVSKSYLADKFAEEGRSGASPLSRSAAQAAQARADEDEETHENADQGEGNRGYGTLSSILPTFSLSRYSKAKRERARALPDGVVEPSEWIKNAGPLKIEPKVWLANERTFLKWQHISILLGGLAVGLYSAAGKNKLAAAMGATYVIIAGFAGAWGYFIMRKRRAMVLQRSGRDFDFMVGPLVVSGALMVALVINFVLAVSPGCPFLGCERRLNAILLTLENSTKQQQSGARLPALTLAITRHTLCFLASYYKELLEICRQSYRPEPG
jgi:SPX domain protein involved in polyphosphate accumulation/uncharacterized membrane protein YidH (DUF202 family)